MADSSYFRDKAEQAIRLAKDSTDPVLQNDLTALALDYFAKAVAVEALPSGKDLDEHATATPTSDVARLLL